MKRSSRRLVFWLVAIVLIATFVLPEVLDPYGDKEWTEINHGNHVHFVPEGRDMDVPLDRFPTTEPMANQQILLDGSVVARRPWIEVKHDDHIHFVPRDRDEDVDIHNFPRIQPLPSQRILPDGRVVAK